MGLKTEKKLPDLGFGLRQGARVVDDIISPPDFFGQGHLGSDPSPGSGFADFVPNHQTTDLLAFFSGDHQHGIDPPFGTGLKQQRRFVDDQTLLLGQLAKPLFGQLGNGWMHDTVEIGPCLRIGKNDFSQGFAIQGTVAQQYRRSEALDQLLQNRRTGNNDFAGQFIGTHHDRAEGTKHPDNTTFTGGYSAGDSKNHRYPPEARRMSASQKPGPGARNHFTSSFPF